MGVWITEGLVTEVWISEFQLYIDAARLCLTTGGRRAPSVQLLSGGMAVIHVYITVMSTLPYLYYLVYCTSYRVLVYGKSNVFYVCVQTLVLNSKLSVLPQGMKKFDSCIKCFKSLLYRRSGNFAVKVFSLVCGKMCIYMTLN